ncbi:hypothetical protein EGI31_02740 [Lacihabitans soyangensis]|uniref:Uncharacterized protein n=1 Tax=Lacihabitans soyangensis TaxID=869394 RepID=A0AAE3KR46_9BACT|nr:hypothetical protein [Lacihabitans soyangensis]
MGFSFKNDKLWVFGTNKTEKLGLRIFKSRKQDYFYKKIIEIEEAVNVTFFGHQLLFTTFFERH